MRFSVIYSVDARWDVDIGRLVPTNVALWEQTEGDEQYAYRHLGGRWEPGRHRKWTALLDRDEFDTFVAGLGMWAVDVPAMGSFGAPGCGASWTPAIFFQCELPGVVSSAYVTPLPDVRKADCDERDWDRVRRAVLSVYSTSGRSLRRRGDAFTGGPVSTGPNPCHARRSEGD